MDCANGEDEINCGNYIVYVILYQQTLYNLKVFNKRNQPKLID